MLPKAEMRTGEGAEKSHWPIYSPHQAPTERAIKPQVLEFACSLRFQSKWVDHIAICRLFLILLPIKIDLGPLHLDAH
jgi:hypothetical protein